LNLGAFYLDTGDAKFRPEAAKALKKSIDLTPSYPAYANLGSLYYDEQRYSEAASLTEKALQMNDKNYLVWQNLVSAYQWLHDAGKTDSARENTIHILEQTIRDKPQDSLARSVLASLYGRKKLADKAASQIQTALALAPTDPATLENIGAAYENLGDRKKALEFVRKAVDAGYPADKIKNDPELQELLKDQNFRFNGK
jgi:serine/threonine-protein kinase